MFTKVQLINPNERNGFVKNLPVCIFVSQTPHIFFPNHVWLPFYFPKKLNKFAEPLTWRCTQLNISFFFFIAHVITQNISDCTNDKDANFTDLDNMLKSWSKERNITLNSFVIATGLNCKILLILVNGTLLDIEELKNTLLQMTWKELKINTAILFC